VRQCEPPEGSTAPARRRIVVVQMLPTFLVIGAAKAGTTSLFYYLRQHADIYLAPTKETNFYWAEGAAEGRRIPRTLEEYGRCFAGARAQRAIGEISPQYLNSPTAPARIRADLPDIRLIAVLRNPVERAWSDYLGRMRIARETRAAEEAIQPGQRIFEHGCYAPRLARYAACFPPARLHVGLHDDFVADPRGTLRTLFRFLDVDPDAPIDMGRRHNEAAVPASARLNRVLWTIVPAAQRFVPVRLRGTGMAERLLKRTYRPAGSCPPALARRLREAYRDDIVETGRLIGRDLSGWLVNQS
jgi:hypothetical protein